MSNAPSLETVFTDHRFFGVTTATPVQRAICRIAEGLPLGELATCDDVRQAVGGDEALAILAPGTFRPRELDVLAGVRSGKSRFVAAHAFWSSQVVNLAHLQAGETPRYPILSINLQSAGATFGHLVGTTLARPLMRGLLIGEPTSDTIYIRHPSGRAIEVTAVAGARAGANLISVWLVGAAFEEHARQAGSAEGFIVNYDDQLNSAIGRTLGDGQILSAGAPWAAHGPAYERHAAYFGRPSPDRVVIVATGPQMNPSWWTPARCEALERSNITAYTTDVLARFADPTSSFLTQSEVKGAIREGALVLPPREGRGYLFAMDPATRRNAWTLIGMAYHADRDGVTRYEVVLCRQWIGSSTSPLSPGAVLAEIAGIVAAYASREVTTDQHAADFVVELGARVGLKIWVRTVTPGNSPEPSTGKPPTPGRTYRNTLYETMKGAFSTGVLSIPNDRVLVSDLLSIRRRLTRDSVSYDLPETSDGRHADYAAALALVLSEFPSAADVRFAGARVERDTRAQWLGAIVAGSVPAGQFETALALANGADPDTVGQSMWTRIALARRAANGPAQTDGALPYVPKPGPPDPPRALSAEELDELLMAQVDAQAKKAG